MKKTVVYSLLSCYVAFVVVLMIPQTIGIKCWVCNSYTDIKCADPFDNRSYIITDCNSVNQLRDNLPNVPATMCRKMSFKAEGVWRYTRSCGFLGEPGIGGDERYCQRRKGTDDIYIEDCLCRGKDGCNESSRPLVDMLPYILILGLGLKLIIK